MVNGAAGRGLVAFAYASSLSVRPCRHRRGTDWLRIGEVTTYFPLPAVRRVTPKRYYFAIHNKAMPVSIGHLICKRVRSMNGNKLANLSAQMCLTRIAT